MVRIGPHSWSTDSVVTGKCQEIHSALECLYGPCSGTTKVRDQVYGSLAVDNIHAITQV